MFSKRIQTTAVIAVFCFACLLSVDAQQRPNLFDKIERTIATSQPEWTLLNRWSNPNPGYKVIMYRWQLDRNAILAWMIEEQSAEDAARTFYEIAPRSTKLPPQQLQIGDKCYFFERSTGEVTLLLRKENLVVKLDSGDHFSGQVSPRDEVINCGKFESPVYLVLKSQGSFDFIGATIREAIFPLPTRTYLFVFGIPGNGA